MMLWYCLMWNIFFTFIVLSFYDVKNSMKNFYFDAIFVNIPWSCWFVNIFVFLFEFGNKTDILLLKRTACLYSLKVSLTIRKGGVNRTNSVLVLSYLMHEQAKLRCFFKWTQLKGTPFLEGYVLLCDYMEIFNCTLTLISPKW